ncbi:hypothetical protein QAB15_016555 [Enterobacter hormaechei]|nr:hypothetical protein [Enterobacter hormaechei]MEC5968300.1 hypothetical protein [Enterobacter hormaechei]
MGKQDKIPGISAGGLPHPS